MFVKVREEHPQIVDSNLKQGRKAWDWETMLLQLTKWAGMEHLHSKQSSKRRMSAILNSRF